MNLNPFSLAMISHMAWVAVLYALMTVLRAPKIWNVDTPSGTIGNRRDLEPRLSANLSNQFEWPIFFYVACVLILVGGHASDPVQVILAWVFVGGRLLHSFVQILTTNIRLRGIVLAVNFIAVLGMWARIFFQ